MKMKMAVAMGVIVFALSACGRTESPEEAQTNVAGDAEEISDSTDEIQGTQDDEIADSVHSDPTEGKEDVLESLTGEYEYLSDHGNGRLVIQKTSSGYDISDYESEESWRFLAGSSDIETVEDGRIYLKYPEQVFSDDTVVFSYYIIEYTADGIDVYYGKSSFEEVEFLYHATRKTEAEEERLDFTCDYSEDIRADVDYVVSVSASLQEELESIVKIIQKYTPLAQAAETQGEMNVSSQWFFVIWDTELNSLWNRFSNSADQQTKENILAEQRNWIDMKEEATLLSIGDSEENGSMYPLLQNSFLEEITRRRAYVLANELAKVKGEPFVLPQVSPKYGLFVDNQGTGSIYSSLLVQQAWEGGDEAIISIYRQGEIEGTFVDNGNGELAFTSYDGNVKGTIQINGWDGASFKVTETSGVFGFFVGEEVEFPVAF